MQDKVGQHGSIVAGQSDLEVLYTRTQLAGLVRVTVQWMYADSQRADRLGRSLYLRAAKFGILQPYRNFADHLP